MYSGAKLGWSYIQYYLKSSNGKGHGIHSPFVFDFITQVLNDDRHFYAYTHIENLRKILLSDPSPVGKGAIKTIAEKGELPSRYVQLLFRIAAYYSPGTILSVGASSGVDTAYLASAMETAQVIVVEENTELAALAKRNFDKLKLNNINAPQKSITDALGIIAEKENPIDIVYMDADTEAKNILPYYHQLKPFLHENSFLIFKNIHVSKEAEQVWQEMRLQEDVTLSINLFSIGLIFFRKENKVKQDFTIRF